jgi:capsid protein
LDAWEDAALMRQKIAACFAAFVTDVDGSATPIGSQNPNDAYPLVETLEPGMLVRLPPGKSVVTADPPITTETGYTVSTLRRIAASIGVPYSEMANDYSQVNYSSARMERLAHYASVKVWREHMLGPLMLDGIWKWAMNAAQFAGELPAGVPVTADWTAPPVPMLEPDKEILAASRAVRNGVKTLSEVIREQGDDPDTHLEEYAADMARLDELHLKLDCDVRAVSQSGQEQPPDPSETEPEAEEQSPGKTPKKKAT